MIRWSICDSNDQFRDALTKIHLLWHQGVSPDDIVNQLSAEFQPQEIRDVLKSISYNEQKDDLQLIKSLLKVSLWILLLFKLSYIYFSFASSEQLTTVQILLVMASPFINILALILVYRETQSSYIIIFCILLLSALNSDTMLDVFFDPQANALLIFLQVVQLVAFVSAIFSLFRLFKKIPVHLLQIRKKIKDFKLEFKPFD